MKRATTLRWALVLIGSYVLAWGTTYFVGCSQVEDLYLLQLRDTHGEPANVNRTVEERVKAFSSDTADFYPVHSVGSYSPAPFVVVVDWSRSYAPLGGNGYTDRVLWFFGWTRTLSTKHSWIS